MTKFFLNAQVDARWSDLKPFSPGFGNIRHHSGRVGEPVEAGAFNRISVYFWALNLRCFTCL
jgi:hypothetical protein